jgi:hypothetical protein
METKTRKPSAVVRYFAASLICLVIGLRFYSMGDPVGTAIYACTTSAALVMAFIQLVKG